MCLSSLISSILILKHSKCETFREFTSEQIGANSHNWYTFPTATRIALNPGALRDVPLWPYKTSNIVMATNQQCDKDLQLSLYTMCGLYQRYSWAYPERMNWSRLFHCKFGAIDTKHMSDISEHGTPPATTGDAQCVLASPMQWLVSPHTPGRISTNYLNCMTMLSLHIPAVHFRL